MKEASPRYRRWVKSRRWAAARFARPVGQQLELRHLPFEPRVALEDLRGVERRELLDHRLHEVLLVLGVLDQELHQVAPAAGDRADRPVVVGVDAPGVERDREQLAANALVDVAVDVDLDRLQRCGLGEEGSGRGDGRHRWLLGSGAAPPPHRDRAPATILREGPIPRSQKARERTLRIRYFGDPPGKGRRDHSRDGRARGVALLAHRGHRRRRRRARRQPRRGAPR